MRPIRGDGHVEHTSVRIHFLWVVNVAIEADQRPEDRYREVTRRLGECDRDAFHRLLEEPPNLSLIQFILKVVQSEHQRSPVHFVMAPVGRERDVVFERLPHHLAEREGLLLY